MSNCPFSLNYTQSKNILTKKPQYAVEISLDLKMQGWNQGRKERKNTINQTFHHVSGTFQSFAKKMLYIHFFFLPPMPPHVLVDFVVFPPGHGRCVTDFWGWDAHEAQLRCPNDMSGDIGGCSARRALKPKFYYPYPDHGHRRNPPLQRKFPRYTGNRTRDLMISRQRLCPLDHEAGQMLYSYKLF